MRFCLILWVLLFGLKGVAQQNVTFGTVSLKELTQDVYPEDSSAEAVVLYEKGVIHFLYEPDRTLGFYTETKIHVRKKILKTSGLQEHAVVIIPYYQGSTGYEEQVFNINGSVFNLENGRVARQELSQKSVFSEKVQGEYYQEKILFPNVKEGSIIEYEYLIRTPMAVRDKPRTWYFQEQIPKRWSELEVIVPPNFHYKIMSSGFLELHTNKREEVSIAMGHSWLDGNKGIKYILAVKDAPAFKDEQFITSDEDYLMKIDFELSQIALPNQPVRNFSVTWQDLDKTLLTSDSWGGRLKKDGFLAEEAGTFKRIEDRKERLSKAHQYMTSAYKWNGRRGLWVHESLKKIHENKTGTASELNMLMLAFLRELGFDAHPVILSTRSHGKIEKEFALIDKFNYTLVMVELDGEKIMIDITDPLLKPGSIPHDCLNNLARVVKPKDGEIITITDKDKYRELESFKVSFDLKNGKISGNYANQSSGYTARNLRAEYYKTGEAEFQKKIKGQFNKLKVNDLKLNNFDDIFKNTEVAFDFETGEDSGDPDVLYVDPMHFGKTEKNPFAKKNRVYPVDFGHLTEHTVMGTIVIPEGYMVEELPKSVAIGLPESAGRFTYVCSKNEQEIQVVSKIILNKSLFPSDHYESLRDFYQRIIQKQGEQIVLKKK